MGFNLGKTIGHVVDPLNSVIGDVFNKALHPGSTTVGQVPLETPEQRQAREMLAQFMRTGQFGNFTAGADIGIKGPNTGLTSTENSGMSALQTLLASPGLSIPGQFGTADASAMGFLNGGGNVNRASQYGLGDTALKDLLTVDPNQIQAQFDPFKAQVERTIGQSNKDLLRTAGFSGKLYSTNTIQGLGDIQARGNETLTAQLANLTNDALNRKAAAIPLAYQSGAAQEGLDASNFARQLSILPLLYASGNSQASIAQGNEGAAQNRISSAFNYGGLPRTLANQGTDAANAEILRKRAEQLLPLNAASGVAGTNANFGVPSVTTQNPNPLLDLLTALISGGSKIAAAKA